MKALLIEKVPTRKMGDLGVPQIQLKKIQSAGVFCVQGRGKREGQGVTGDHSHLGASRGPRKTVFSLLTLSDVGPVTRLLHDFDKQYIRPLAPPERHFLVRGCFCNTQAASSIPLMISRSKARQSCRTKQTWSQRGPFHSVRDRHPPTTFCQCLPCARHCAAGGAGEMETIWLLSLIVY